MRAALLTAVNQPLEIREVTPHKLRAGQVLVRVLTSGICGAQLQEIRGEKGTHFPRFMGHEGCGIVEEVGPNSTKFQVGQKVVMHWRKGSGAEAQSPLYWIDPKTSVTSGQVTTFSEFSVCSENRLTAVPHEIPNELCALLGCGLSTALGVMENEAKLKMGESVLIVGCGGVGLNLIRVAKMMGARLVFGVDSSPNFVKKWDSVKEAGGTFLTQKPGELGEFDVIVDTTGSPEAIAETIPLLASGGRYVLVGQPKSDASIVLTTARHLFDGDGKRIIGTQGGQFNPEKDIPRYLRMWKSGHLKIDGIITNRFPFEKINEAIELVKSGNAGRVMLEMI
jgi:S-(hydroxymethyl)glutathione dehydrogenase/alcohol dehydrogenase